MKKFVLLLSAATIAFFSSCEERQLCPDIPCECQEPPEDEDITSLTGTMWIARSENGDEWLEHQFVFTSSHYIYSIVGHLGVSPNSSYGKYTFDPPEITLTDPGLYSEITGKPLISRGAIEDGIMTIGLYTTFDMMVILTLKRVKQ